MTNTLFQVMKTATGWKLQFSGTVDVTEEQQRAIVDSGLSILVVAARTGKLAVEFKENGEAGLKATVLVSDAALMTGELRDGAMAYLAYGPDQGRLVFPNYGYTGELEPGAEPVPDSNGSSNGSITDDEVPEGGFDLDDGEPVPVRDDGGTEILGHVGDYRGGAAPQPSGGEGPKVGKFDPDMVPSAPGGGTERVGSVYPQGPQRKDTVLADFMNEEHPRA